MTQESRLALSIESRSAEQKADDFAKALRALELVGLRAAESTDAAGKSFAGAGRDATAGASGVDRMNKSLSSTDTAANAAMGSLKRLFAAATAGIGAMSAIDTADQWGQYASRIKMATRSAEEYDHVQRRMAASANDTYRSISETREGFIQMSPILRDMGLSLDQSIDAIDSFSGLLVINSASADRGAAAMAAYSKSLQKGKVDGDAWATIASTMPSVLKVIADSSGLTEAEIRKLGSEGKLSVEVLNKAFVESVDGIKTAVAGMPTTVRDALQRLNTSFTEYIGWQNEAKGATAALASGVDSLAGNFDGVVNVVGVAAAGALGVYATRMGASTLATLTQSKASVAAAMQQAALTARFNGTSVAAARATVAMRALNVAMGPAGWIGLAATAAAGMYLFRDSANDAKISSDALTISVNSLTSAAERAASRYASLTTSVSNFTKEEIAKRSADVANQLRNAERELANFRRQYERNTGSKGMIEGAEASVALLTKQLADLKAQAETTGSDDAGSKYLANLERQLLMVGKVTEVEKLRAEIQGGLKLSPADEKLALDRAAALDKANEALKAANQLTKDGAKDTAAATKALADFIAQSQLSVTSTNALAAAYLTSADAVSKATREQKIEAEVLKLGEGARAKVTAQINAMEDALEALDLSKTIADMRKQNVALIDYEKVLLAGGTATKAGRKALADYNDTREIEAAMVGKTAKELDKLLPKLREEQRIRREQGDRNAALEELNGLIVETRTNQEKANAELKHLHELLASTDDPKYIDAVNRKIKEVTASTSEWGRFTERALDSVDQAFADAWRNIDKGFGSFADGLKNAFKNLLAEMAHMAITRPIIMQFASMIGIGSGTQGQNGIWGSLLGGTSGGSSGIGGALQQANQVRSLYSAYGTVQSLLPALQGGWASGGLGGAFGAGASSISGMFGLGSGAAGSLAAGSTASGYTGAAFANWAAAQGGTSAAGGAGIGGGMLSGMASAWPLAVAMGIWQSGKLYDAGVRPSAGDMWKSTQGNALGKIGNVAPTAMSGFYKGLDSILEPVVGGKVAAMITGSTFHQALWGGINKALFGGAWQTKDYGIGLGVEGGELDAHQFEYRKKKGGLFSSSKKKTIWSDLDSEVASALDETYAATADGVFSLFESLSYTIEDNALAGLNLAREQVSTKGKTEEEIQTAIAEWFGGAAEAMNTELNRVFSTGLELDLAGMQAFVGNLQGVNEVIRYLNVGMFDMSVAGGKLAESLSAMSGGLDALAGGVSTYYGAFFTEAERMDDTLDAVTRAFADADVTLADSREAYRAMVEDIDLTTEAGQQMFATLMALSGQAAQYFSIVEQQAAQAIAQTQAMLGANVSAAHSQLQRSIQVERDRLTQNYQAQLAQEQAAASARSSAYSDMIDTANVSVQALRSLDSALSRALKTLLGTSDAAVEMMRQQAVALLQDALAIGRSGKSLAAVEGLESALDTASRVDTAIYGSLVEFEREQGRTANLVAELGKIGGKQLTAEERLLEQLRASAASVQSSIGGVSSALTAEYERAMAALDEELAAAQSQLDALNGIDNSVLSVAAAIAQMSAAVTAAMGGQGAAIQQLYQSILGSSASDEGVRFWGERIGESGNYTELVRELNQAATGQAGMQNAIADLYKRSGQQVDAHGLQFWSDAIASGQYSYDDLRKGLGVPGFAAGGYHRGGLRLVGENGPELEVTGPSRIINAADTAAMMKGGGESTVEMRAMRKELADLKSYLYQITKNTGRTSESLRNIEEGAVLA